MNVRWLGLVLAIGMGFPASLLTGQEVAVEGIDLGTRRELFVDEYLLERMDGVELQLHHPQPGPGRLVLDQPWEGAFSGYVTLLLDGGVYRMYYRGLPEAGRDGSNEEVTCVAMSFDGVNWHKPRLDLFPDPQGEPTNIVLRGQAPASHNFAPFVDTNPAARIDQRYKALGGTQAGLLAFVSADGLHWQRMQEAPVFSEGVFDSQNVAFWSPAEQQYVCYFRSWTRQGYSGFRTISRTTSADFVNWSKPEPMSFGDTPMEHLYTNQTSSYFRAPHLLIGLAARFMPGRQVISADQAAAVGVNPRYFGDCSDSVLLTSRGGTRYSRYFMESWIRPGPGAENWVSRSNYLANGVVPTGSGEMSVYLSRRYGQQDAYLQQYVLRTDGFASLHAGYGGGEVLTRPLVVPVVAPQRQAELQQAWEAQAAALQAELSPALTDGIRGAQALALKQPLALELPETAALGENWTLALEVAGLTPGHRRLFSAYNGGSLEPNELIFDLHVGGQLENGECLRFGFDQFRLGIPARAIPDWADRWQGDAPHHLAVTWDRGDCRLFFDGQQVGQKQADMAEVQLALGNLRLGEDLPPASQTNEALLGVLDDVLVLRQTLTPTEIQAIAATGAADWLQHRPEEAPRPSGVWLSLEGDQFPPLQWNGPRQRSLKNSLGGAAIALPPLPEIDLGARQLELNVATSAAGSVAVELLDAEGQPIPGFRLEDCDRIVGDQIDRTVTWRGGHSDLVSLAGQTVRLRIQIHDADVYSLRFR